MPNGWLAGQLPHTLELIRATGDKDKPEATLRSVVNQDYESVHRHAKISWA